MSGIKGTKSSAALIVSVVALVTALGGGAVAGVAVTSLTKKETKKVRKIAKNQANKAVKGIQAGPQGDPGEQGPKGEQGPQGEPGISGLVEVDATSGGASSDSPKKAQAFCPAGKTAIGGSYEINGGQENSSPNRVANVAAQAVRRRSTSYEVEAYETGNGTAELWTVFVRVICADVE